MLKLRSLDTRAGLCCVSQILCGWTWHNEDIMYLGDTFVYSTTDKLWTPIHATGATSPSSPELVFLFRCRSATVSLRASRL